MNTVSFRIGDNLSFSESDGHPVSTVVGIDRYSFDAQDGITRKWNSFTLVPDNKSDAVGTYARWYVVDLPDLGFAFCEIIDQADFPDNLQIDKKLTGKATITSDGNAEMGTGYAYLESFISSDGCLYAREKFSNDDSVMYFKSTILKGPVAVCG
ncbi:MAG TPA: hypothetical protein PLF01_04370 [Alphaproteobacteria bacterium]|nr:hypothetical protein [Alphaproteobacteria bacterium]